MSIELLKGLLYPITKNIGFLNCSANTASQTFLDWQKRIQKERGVDVNIKKINASSLKELLFALEPLTSVEVRRFLFLDTKSNWCAYFDNNWRGADAATIVSYLASIIPCKGLKIGYSPHTHKVIDGKHVGRYGFTSFAVYGLKQYSFLNYERTLMVSFDGYRWEFNQSGKAYEFENTNAYSNRLIKSRFTIEMLELYTKEMGLKPFEETFYNVKNAYFVEKIGPYAPNMEEYSVKEAQKTYFDV